MNSVAVVGTGASAIITVIKLLKAGCETVSWFGGSQVMGSCRYEGELHNPGFAVPFGVAYGLCSSEHYLNVPASAMSPFLDEESFKDFCVETDYRRGKQYENDFYPRNYFNLYLTSILGKYKDQVGSMLLLEPPVRDMHQLDSFKNVVLCLGATRNVANVPDLSTWSYEPWNFNYARLSMEKNLTILGSGLTAIDVAVSAWHANPDIIVEFVSRNGRMPQPMSMSGCEVNVQLNYETCASLIRSIREWVEDAEGFVTTEMIFKMMRHSWKYVWAKWPEKERTRFLKWARPYFEVHRHRLIPQTQKMMNRHRWFVTKLKDKKEWSGYRIGATGISTNPSGNSLLNELKEAKRVNFASSGLGLVATPQCKVGDGLWCVGAYMRDQRWEATAIPDIIDMADTVVSQLKMKREVKETT